MRTLNRQRKLLTKIDRAIEKINNNTIKYMNKSDDTMSESSNSSDEESHNNKYNRLMTEDNILLVFLRIKIYVIKEMTKIIPKEDFLQELFH